MEICRKQPGCTGQRELLHLSGYTLWNETRRMNEWVLHEFAVAQNHDLIETEKHAGGLFTLEEAIEFALIDDHVTSPVSKETVK